MESNKFEIPNTHLEVAKRWELATTIDEKDFIVVDNIKKIYWEYQNGCPHILIWPKEGMFLEGYC